MSEGVWAAVTDDAITKIREQLDEFGALRAAALSRYAEIEEQLVQVMRWAVGCEYEIAHIIFHRTITTRTRYAIIGDALARRDERSIAAWRKLQSWLSEIDRRRNELVHWKPDQLATIHVAGEESHVSHQPALTSLVGSSRKLILDKHLYQFIADATIMRDLVNRFWLPSREPAFQSWRDIYHALPLHLRPGELLRSLNDAMPQGLRPKRPD